MDQNKQESLMRLAIEEAEHAAARGNYPFGVIVVDAENSIIARAQNTQNTDNDPTAHAEMNAIRELAKNYPMAQFASFTLICNAESCSMCFSAAIKAGFRHFVFGAPSELHMEPYLTVTDVQKYCKTELDITRGVLADACRAQIQAARKKQGKLAQ